MIHVPLLVPRLTPLATDMRVGERVIPDTKYSLEVFESMDYHPMVAICRTPSFVTPSNLLFLSTSFHY